MNDTPTADCDAPTYGRRLIDALLGGIFIAAAWVEEVAGRIAEWADELLIRRRVFPSAVDQGDE